VHLLKNDISIRKAHVKYIVLSQFNLWLDILASYTGVPYLITGVRAFFYCYRIFLLVLYTFVLFSTFSQSGSSINSSPFCFRVLAAFETRSSGKSS